MRPIRSVPVSLRTLEPLDRGIFERWVRRAILVTTVAYVVALGADLSILSAGTAPFAASAELVVVVAGVVALVLVRGGRVQGGVLVLLSAVWFELHAWLVQFGLPSTALVAFPVMVAATGMVLGGRVAFVLCGVSTLTISGAGLVSLVMRGEAGTLAPQALYWVVITSASMFATAALLQVGLDSLGRALMAARTNEQRLADLLEHSPDGIIATDADGGILTVNPAAEEILGQPRERLKGRRLADVLGEAWVGARDDWNPATLLAGGHGEATALRFRDDSEYPRWVDVSLGRVPWADGTVGFQIVVRDVTEKREAEETRQLLRSRMEQAQRLEAVGRLAGGVAHEFNNILTSVGVSAELLMEDGRGEILELARQIKSAQVRGARLTRQLLAFARRELAQPRRMSVPRAIRETEPLLRKALGDRVKLTLDLPADAEVVADRTQLEQILVNLVLNAEDAIAGEGEVTVGMAPPGAERSWRDGTSWTVEPGTVEIRVEDDGCGMGPEAMARAFEPFFSTKPPAVAAGLGLATVHGIVIQNGGRIRLMSEPDVGTAVLITWPLAPEA